MAKDVNKGGLQCRRSIVFAFHQLLEMLRTGNQDDVLLLRVSDPLMSGGINQYNDDLYDEEITEGYKISERYLAFMEKLAERSLGIVSRRADPLSYNDPITDLPSDDELAATITVVRKLLESN
jgi:hypothetical protein